MIIYGHRGAAAYMPENTMSSFYTGLFMGADGLETDIQRTRDGVLILFHDDTLGRVMRRCGQKAEGSIRDYTYAELYAMDCVHDEKKDKLVRLEDFLRYFGSCGATLALELKVAGIEADTVQLLRTFNLRENIVITSFCHEWLLNVRQLAPELRCGLLCGDASDELIAQLRQEGFAECCPDAKKVNSEAVRRIHSAGLGCRMWGISNEAVMRKAVLDGADGMTVNFPDKLTAYLHKNNI